MHQHNPDEPRVDATAAYTGELDLNFTAQYPLLQTEQDIGMLLDGQTPFVSLKIPRTPTTDPFFKKALATILEVAGTEGHPAYSAHAFGGHTTAPEVIDTICQYIAAGDFTVEPQRHYKKVRVLTPTGAEAQETVLVERYIVKTPPYERTTGVPVPRLEQQRIFSSGIEEKGQLKQARRLTRERGAAFGILLMAYQHLKPDGIFDFFDTPDFKKELKNRGETPPSRNRPGDRELLWQITELLTLHEAPTLTPSPNPERYRQTLDLLRKSGYVVDGENFGFQETTQLVYAQAVLIGGTEKAHDLAPPELRNPVRSEHIDERYGPRITSHLATAYLVPLE